MARNNKRINYFKTINDLQAKANQIQNSISKPEAERTIEDIKNIAQYIHKGKDIVVESNITTLPTGKNSFERNSNKADKSNIKKSIENLEKINFFDIVSGKISTSEETMLKAIDLSKEIMIQNQKGNSNQSLYDTKKNIKKFMDLTDSSNPEDAFFYVYDLETYGGNNLNNVWSPLGITEYSMHKYDAKTGKKIASDSHDIVIGLTEKQGSEMLERIKNAIKDNSIYSDEELRVTAARLSLYGDRRTSIKKHSSNDYYYVNSFVDSDEADIKDIKKIEEGIKRLVNVRKNVGTTNGVPNDVYNMMKSVAATNESLLNERSMIIGYNSLLFDSPILNAMGNKYLTEYPQLKGMLNMNNFEFLGKSDNHLDVRAITSHIKNYYSSKTLLPGYDLSKVGERLNRQEVVAKAILGDKTFNSLGPAHVASTDVTALFRMLYEKTGMYEHNGKTLNLIEYSDLLLSKIDSENAVGLNKNFIFQAKKNTNTFGGKGVLNFAINGEGKKYIATDTIVENGVANMKGFNVGANINKDGFYKIRSAQHISADDEYLKIVNENFPQYANKNLYALTLDRVVTDKYKNTKKVGDLSNVILFTSQSEMNAFISNSLNLVGESDGENFKIYDKDAFDIRQYKNENGKIKFEDIKNNSSRSDKEIMEDAFDFQANKVLTSRANNWATGESSYNNISKVVNIQNEVQKKIKRKLQPRELELLMSERVATKQLPFSIEENTRKHLQKNINEILKNQFSGEVLDSSIDNVSTYAGIVGDKLEYYDLVINTIDKYTEGVSSKVKQKYFNIVDKELKENLARGLYTEDSDIKNSILNNGSLKASLSKFKSMYELDLNKAAGVSKTTYTDITQSNPANLLRLDLDDNNLAYKIIKGVREAIYPNLKDSEGLNKKATRQFFEQIYNDKEFKDIFYNYNKKDKKWVINSFGQEIQDIKDGKDFNAIDLTERFIKSLKNVKSKNPTAGIKSNYLYMTDLELNKGFNGALNSLAMNTPDEMVKQIKSIIDNTSIMEINGNVENARTFAKKYLLDAVVQPSDTTDSLYKNAKSEMLDYLTELTLTVDKAKGSLSVDGDNIVMHANGKRFDLNITKVKQDADSGYWYTQTGNMKNQLLRKLNIKNKNGISIDVGTTLGANLNAYPMSKSIEKVYKKEGQSAAIDAINYAVKSANRKVSEGSTINNFNMNDGVANRSIDLNDVSNILEDLFSQKGDLHHLIKNKKFLDLNLQDTMEYFVERYNGKGIDELDTSMTKHLVKNIKNVLEVVSKHVNISDEAKEIISQISMTGTVKKTSSMVGVIGNMPVGDISGIFNDVKRPTITQSLNAIPVRVEDIENAGLIPGKIITSKAIDKEMTRNVSGIGKTTTDVMMDIAYLDVDSLAVLKNAHFDKVMNDNNIDKQTKEIARKALNTLAKMNTYEQERHMDPRVFEETYGQLAAQIQNISNSKDFISALELMTPQEARRQNEFLMSHRGAVRVNNGKLVFESAVGTHVKRGDDLVKIIGYGDKLETFSPKVKNGIFLHQYVKSNGMILRDDEITNIINNHRELFLNADGSVKAKENVASALEDLLENKYSAKGVYKVEDINLIGKVKPMTSDAEKGMTNLDYNMTGTINKNIKGLFTEIGIYEDVKGGAWTDNAVDAFLKPIEKGELSNLLNKYGFKDVKSLKEAMKEERMTSTDYIYNKIFHGKAQMIVNDDVIKHSGFGQMQFAVLNKAIDNLIKHNDYDEEATAKQVTDLINSNKDYQFIERRNIKTGKKSSYKFSVQDGKIFSENLGTNVNETSVIHAERLKALVSKIDSITNVSSGNVNLEGILSIPVTKEPVKMLPDVETQSGTDAQYFRLQEQLQALESEKRVTSDEMKKIQLNKQINEVKQQIGNYETFSKRMKLGVTEVQLLERIRVTDKHAEEIERLFAKGEITDEIIASQALKGRVIKNADGSINFKESITAKSALSPWIQQFTDLLGYNPLTEEALTDSDVLLPQYKHLLPIYQKANKLGKTVGKESAEKIYKLGQAELANKFNNSKTGPSRETLLKNGFEEVKLSDMNWDADEIANKDLLIDLGEAFEENRYIAMPGTGHVLGKDDEILTNGQKKVYGLSETYKDWLYERGGIKEDEAYSKVLKKMEDAKKGIHDSIYGKNAYADTIRKIEVNNDNQRYKASGIVVSKNDVNLMRLAKEQGLDIETYTTYGSLNKAQINGKTLAEHHAEGRYYDYKFVSLEAMKNKGLFNRDKMESYGIQLKDENGVEKTTEQLNKEMTELLSKYGTVDVSDRYPNNKNDSVILTHTFLDTNLQGNETKVAGQTGQKMLLDHDGDSVSSFGLNIDGYDYGAFVNRRNQVVNKLGQNASEEAIKSHMISNGMTEQAYEAFKDIEAITTVRAMTENKSSQALVDSILEKDHKRNMNSIGNLDETVTVKNGQSILGKISIGAYSNQGTLEELNTNRDAVNLLIQKAGETFSQLPIETQKQLNNAKIAISEQDFYKTVSGDRVSKVITDEDPATLLDKALTVLQEGKNSNLISESEFNSFESHAISRIALDKHSVSATAKTGAAATGNINVAVNSIKLASKDLLINSDASKADMINTVLDVPEQAAISSKKITSAYDDSKEIDFTEMLKRIYGNNKASYEWTNEDREDFKNWFVTHGSDKLADAYDMYANYYATEVQRNTVNSNIEKILQRNISPDEAKELIKQEKAGVLMDNTIDALSTLSADEQFQAKRLFYKSRGAAENVGAAHFGETDFKNYVYQLIDREDVSFGTRKAEMDRITKEAMQRQAHSNQMFNGVSSSSVKASSSMISNFAEKVVSNMSSGGGSGLGKAMLGMAAGMLATGYSMGNPLNDKQASQMANEHEPQQQTMSIPEFMEKQGGYVTGNAQQGYIINIKADTKKGRKHMQNMMKQAAQASVGGAVSINMNIRNLSNGGITDSDIENFLDRHL